MSVELFKGKSIEIYNLNPLEDLFVDISKQKNIPLLILNLPNVLNDTKNNILNEPKMIKLIKNIIDINGVNSILFIIDGNFESYTQINHQINEKLGTTVRYNIIYCGIRNYVDQIRNYLDNFNLIYDVTLYPIFLDTSTKRFKNIKCIFSGYYLGSTNILIKDYVFPNIGSYIWSFVEFKEYNFLDSDVLL